MVAMQQKSESNVFAHPVDHIAERIARVRERIRRAAHRVGRVPEEITLLAVTKSFPPDAVAQAFAAGIRHFGENRVQEARRKIPFCPAGITWHMIGYVQTNKATWVVRLFTWVHAIDRLRLIEALESAAARYQRRLQVLIEVRLSPEPTKHGCTEDAVPVLVDRLLQAHHLDFVGFMTIPPYHPDPERSRPYFRRLREIRDATEEMLQERGIRRRLHLSMGMSHDFEVAIEEGATIVRIGTAIFGERPEP